MISLFVYDFIFGFLEYIRKAAVRRALGNNKLSRYCTCCKKTLQYDIESRTCKWCQYPFDLIQITKEASCLPRLTYKIRTNKETTYTSMPYN